MQYSAKWQITDWNVSKHHAILWQTAKRRLKALHATQYPYTLEKADLKLHTACKESTKPLQTGKHSLPHRETQYAKLETQSTTKGTICKNGFADHHTGKQNAMQIWNLQT